MHFLLLLGLGSVLFVENCYSKAGLRLKKVTPFKGMDLCSGSSLYHHVGNPLGAVQKRSATPGGSLSRRDPGEEAPGFKQHPKESSLRPISSLKPRKKRNDHGKKRQKPYTITPEKMQERIQKGKETYYKNTTPEQRTEWARRRKCPLHIKHGGQGSRNPEAKLTHKQNQMNGLLGSLRRYGRRPQDAPPPPPREPPPDPSQVHSWGPRIFRGHLERTGSGRLIFIHRPGNPEPKAEDSRIFQATLKRTDSGRLLAHRPHAFSKRDLGNDVSSLLHSRKR